MFAGIILLLSLCQNESPRFLIKQNKPEDALKTLARIRSLPPDHEYVVREIIAIQHSHQDELEATMGSGLLGVLKEALLIRSKLYRLYLAAMARFVAPVKSTLLSSDILHFLCGGRQKCLDILIQSPTMHSLRFLKLPSTSSHPLNPNQTP